MLIPLLAAIAPRSSFQLPGLVRNADVQAAGSDQSGQAQSPTIAEALSTKMEP